MSKEFIPYVTLKERAESILPKEERQKLVEKYTNNYNITKSDEILEIIDLHLAVLEKEKYNTTWLRQDFTTIKQYILKAQEQEKENAEYKRVLEIIKEKNVDIEYIKTCFYDEKGGLKEYNSWVGHDQDKELTEEEYSLLKKWLENGK